MRSRHPEKVGSSKPSASKTPDVVSETSASPGATPESGAGAQREALIRLAAYAAFERRGCVYGHEIEDWLRAEMEVDRQLAAGH